MYSPAAEVATSNAAPRWWKSEKPFLFFRVKEVCYQTWSTWSWSSSSFSLSKSVKRWLFLVMSLRYIYQIRSLFLSLFFLLFREKREREKETNSKSRVFLFFTIETADAADGQRCAKRTALRAVISTLVRWSAKPFSTRNKILFLKREDVSAYQQPHLVALRHWQEYK